MQATDPHTLQKLAETGDVQAQIQLGRLRLSQERFDDAAGWLKLAAENGNVEGQCLFGRLLSEGLGVDQDLEAAAYWFRQAAEEGHAAAQCLLAQTFESGFGVPANKALALQWYRKAAEQGDSVAQLRVAQILLQGDNRAENLEEAEKWLRQSAEAGCLPAQVDLIELLVEKPDFDKNDAARWMRSAADKGSAQAMYRLGWMYEHFSLGAAAIDEAVKCYRAAGDAGSTDAQMRLAKLYAEGKIVTEDQSEAERWLNMAVGDGKSSPAKEVVAAQVNTVAPFMSINEYPPGSIIEKKYFIMSLLGKGGTCMVYKAKHLIMNKMVAIKMLLPQSASNPNQVERFKREAQAASSLNHNNVITIYDIGISPDGKPYMVLDYLEGESLEQRIEANGALSLKDFIHIFLQVCAALDCAHESSIIHRDIKPSNIMLTRSKFQNDLVKLVDFGLAKLLDGNEQGGAKLTKTGEVFGTLVYMSPEQCLGHPLDLRTDVYSVGCTMYEAITGTPVFRGATAYELMNQHINVAAEPFATRVPQLNCPPELERIIMKALSKNREERHQTMVELHQDLAALQ